MNSESPLPWEWRVTDFLESRDGRQTDVCLIVTPSRLPQHPTISLGRGGVDASQCTPEAVPIAWSYHWYCQRAFRKLRRAGPPAISTAVVSPFVHSLGRLVVCIALRVSRLCRLRQFARASYFACVRTWSMNRQEYTRNGDALGGHIGGPTATKFCEPETKHRICVS